MRIQLKKTVSSALLFSMVLGAAALPAADTEAAKKPKLSSSKVTVNVGKSKTIKVKNTKKKVKWSVKSGKKNIKLVKKAKTSLKFTGVKAGSAVITASVAGKKLTCKVKVKKVDDKLPDSGKTTPTPPVVTSAPPAATQPAATKPAATQPAATQPAATQAPTETPAGPIVATPGPGEYEGTDISWIDPNKPMVAFTFDDGPIGNKDTDTSMIIQNSLREHNAHATFFYIGSRLGSIKDGEIKLNEGPADEIRQAVASGFEAGNHSNGWDPLTTKTYTEEKVRESIGTTDVLLTEVTGYRNFLFRPPSLAVNKTMQETIEAPFIMSGTDSQDWNKATTEQIIANVKKAKDGDIVLMHETEKNTAEVIDTLLDYFKEKDWQVVSVSELFLVRGMKMEDGVSYKDCPPASTTTEE